MNNMLGSVTIWHEANVKREQFEYLEDSTSENTKQNGRWNCLSSLGRNKWLVK